MKYVYTCILRQCTCLYNKKREENKIKIKNHTVSRLHLGARKGRPEGRCCLPSVACGLRGGRTSRSIPASFIWSRSLVSLSPWSTSCSTPTTGPNDAMCVGWATGKFFFFILLFFLCTKLEFSVYERFTPRRGLRDGCVQENGPKRCNMRRLGHLFYLCLFYFFIFIFFLYCFFFLNMS